MKLFYLLTFLLYSSLQANDYNYCETKSYSTLTYKKDVSVTYYDVGEKRYKNICYISMRMRTIDINSSSMDITYLCMTDEKPPLGDNGNSENNIEDIALNLKELIEHYSLQDRIRNMNDVRIFLNDSGVSSSFLIKKLNTMPQWNKTVYKELNQRNYVAKIRELIKLSSVYKNIQDVFLFYGMKMKILENFTEHLFHNGEPELISKNEMMQHNLFNNKEIYKDYYPNVNWVHFELKYKDKPNLKR